MKDDSMPLKRILKYEYGTHFWNMFQSSILEEKKQVWAQYSKSVLTSFITKLTQGVSRLETNNFLQTKYTWICTCPFKSHTHFGPFNCSVSSIHEPHVGVWTEQIVNRFACWFYIINKLQIKHWKAKNIMAFLAHAQ